MALDKDGDCAVCGVGCPSQSPLLANRSRGKCRLPARSEEYLENTSGSGRAGMKLRAKEEQIPIGATGCILIVSFIIASTYFSLSRSWTVGNRSRPTIRSISSRPFRCTSGCSVIMRKNVLIDDTVVSDPPAYISTATILVECSALVVFE